MGRVFDLFLWFYEAEFARVLGGRVFWLSRWGLGCVGLRVSECSGRC